VKLAEGDIVALTVNSPSAGDKKLVYPAGHQFRVRRLVTHLPADQGEVRDEQQHGHSPKPRPTRMSAVEPMVEVLALTPDRSRLLFRPADLERVPTGDTTCDA